MADFPSIESNIERLLPYVVDYADYANSAVGKRVAREVLNAKFAASHITSLENREALQSWRGFFLGIKQMMDEGSPLREVADCMRAFFATEGCSEYDSEFSLGLAVKALVEATPAPPLRWQNTSPTFAWLIGQKGYDLDEARCCIDIREDGRCVWETYGRHAAKGIAPNLDAAKRAAEAMMKITTPFPDSVK